MSRCFHGNIKNFIEFLTKRHMNAPEQSTDNLLQTFINILSQSRAFREKFPQRIVTIAIECCLNHKTNYLIT